MIIQTVNGHIYLIKNNIVKKVLYINKDTNVYPNVVGYENQVSYTILTQIEFENLMLSKL